MEEFLHKVVRPGDQVMLVTWGTSLSLDVPMTGSLAVIEKPVEAFEGHFAVHVLIDIQEARDAFIVSGMQSERPLVRGEQRHHTGRGHVQSPLVENQPASNVAGGLPSAALAS